jgi:peroxiredoxin
MRSRTERKTMTRYSLAIVLAFCTLLSARAIEIKAEWLEGNADQRLRLKDIEGKPAPKLQLSDWKGSKELKLEDLKGKIVILDFWATWCGPCLRSIPHNNEIYNTYKDKGVVFIGVCHPKGSDKADSVIEKRSIEYPVAIDADSKTIKAYKVTGFPDYYIIDKQGNLVAGDCKNSKVEDVVDALLAEGK